LRKVITVAAPFYGYGGQLHRWFEGEPLVNVGDVYKKGIIRALSSFPGCYSWHFLPEAFYNANTVGFQNDLAAYRLASYPSVDLMTNDPTDPYNPQPPGQRYPTKAQSGFDAAELGKAATLFGTLTSPLTAAQAAIFVNIRGDTNANNTLNTTTRHRSRPTGAPQRDHRQRRRRRAHDHHGFAADDGARGGGPWNSVERSGHGGASDRPGVDQDIGRGP
jgi:hypothetical protein